MYKRLSAWCLIAAVVSYNIVLLRCSEVDILTVINESYSFFWWVILIMVSGERYRKMSLSNSCSSISISPASRTTKMSLHSLSTRSTHGSSSYMMDRDMPVKNSRTNLPMTSTTDMYIPTMLQHKRRENNKMDRFHILNHQFIQIFIFIFIYLFTLFLQF